MRATAIPNMEILLRLVAESPSGSTYGHAEKGRHNRSPNAPPRPRTSTGEPLPGARPPEGSAGAPRPPAVSAGSVPVGARGSVPGPDPAAPPRSARPHRRPRNGAASAAVRVGPAGRGAAPPPPPPGQPPAPQSGTVPGPGGRGDPPRQSRRQRPRCRETGRGGAAAPRASRIPGMPRALDAAAARNARRQRRGARGGPATHKRRSRPPLPQTAPAPLRDRVSSSALAPRR